MTFSKHAVRLFLKIIKKFRLYRVERHFKISQDFEKHITTLKIKLKQKKLPYFVTKILLIGSGKQFDVINPLLFHISNLQKRKGNLKSCIENAFSLPV